MERRHRNARRGPTDSRRIESAVGLHTAFEDLYICIWGAIEKAAPNRDDGSFRRPSRRAGPLNRKYTRRAGKTNRPGPAETNGPVPAKTEGVHPSARVDAYEPQPPDRISARAFPGRDFGQRDPLPGTRNRRRADRNADRQPGFGSLPTARTLRPSMQSKAGRPRTSLPVRSAVCGRRARRRCRQPGFPTTDRHRTKKRGTGDPIPLS